MVVTYNPDGGIVDIVIIGIGSRAPLQKGFFDDVSAQVMPGPYERAMFQVRLVPFVMKKAKEIYCDVEDCHIVTGAFGGTGIPECKHPQITNVWRKHILDPKRPVLDTPGGFPVTAKSVY